MEVKTKEFVGGENEAIGYVFDANLARRHLTVGQKAMIARELATATQGGDRTAKNSCSEVTVPAAAQMLGVSESAVKQAKALKVGAVVSAVKSGGITLGAAAKLEKSVSGEVLQGLSAGQMQAFAKTLDKPEDKVCTKAVRLAREFSEAFVELRRLPEGGAVDQALADCRVWLSRCR